MFPASLTFALHLTDLGMDPLDRGLLPCGIENVYSPARAETEVEVV